eukprot:scaffold136017_cov30-Tisochrysis_lutea.AAC.5
MGRTVDPIDSTIQASSNTLSLFLWQIIPYSVACAIEHRSSTAFLESRESVGGMLVRLGSVFA